MPEQKISQKPQPVAVCTRCGAASYSPEMINGQCSQVTAGKRCTGVNGSALSKTDWEMCSTCHTTGQSGKTRCGHCDGVGWLYLRHRKR